MRAMPSNRPSVLVVDDDSRNLLAFEILFSRLDAEVRLVDSGEQALRELLKRRYEVIVLDVQMPGLDGFATADLIRRRANPPQIVFMSAMDDPRRCAGEGCGDDYFRKPFDAEVLVDRVALLLEAPALQME
jgi:DNA-binding response OmpR family regulator